MAHHKIISVYTSPLGHLALPDISNPILYLSTLSDQDKTSPVALSLIRYYNLPVKQLWEAIRVSKETLQPPFLPRLYSNGHSHVAILDNGGSWLGEVLTTVAVLQRSQRAEPFVRFIQILIHT